jgi:cell division protease FtsH
MNSKNITIRDESILGLYNEPYNNYNLTDDIEVRDEKIKEQMNNLPKTGFKIIIGKNGIQGIGFGENADDNEDEEDEMYRASTRRKEYASNKDKKSEHFEVISRSMYNFTDIGGYDQVKTELNQCVDMLKNMSKYKKYNVRIPKGIVFEGPPGNGKTLIAKALAGEAGTSFITVSGSEFQEKYVGVGPSRIRELFSLAKKNIPCIIFIDEIDALGRKRSTDGELSSSERDSTLNELLVSLDGFKNTSGVFVIGATNRADLLDSALMRPGRIDKKITIGLPDSKTRKAILNIYIKGKPADYSINIPELVELTNGLSGAQIENLLNEAMLNALRENREVFSSYDIETIMNKMMVGWQPTEHQFTDDMINHIAVHEIGHALIGMLSANHANVSKVVINLSSPRSPAYTVFEASTSSLYTREALFEHLMILLSGRIAEEVIYGMSVTTGAINDFEEALKLAEKMIVYYGMGKKLIYPNMSDKYKSMIDDEVAILINDAYEYAEFILRNSKEFLLEGAELLKEEKVIRANTLESLMTDKYKGLLTFKF